MHVKGLHSAVVSPGNKITALCASHRLRGRHMLMRYVRTVRVLTIQPCVLVWLAGFLMLAASPLRAQTFDPTLSVGVGIQTSYQHTETTGATGLNQFALNHARIY